MSQTKLKTDKSSVNQPTLLLCCVFKHKGELFYLSWLAPTWTSNVKLNDVIHSYFGISKMGLFMGLFSRTSLSKRSLIQILLDSRCVFACFDIFWFWYYWNILEFATFRSASQGVCRHVRAGGLVHNFSLIMVSSSIDFQICQSSPSTFDFRLNSSVC